MGLHVRGIIAHQTRYRSISLDIARYRAPGSILLLRRSRRSRGSASEQQIKSRGSAAPPVRMNREKTSIYLQAADQDAAGRGACRAHAAYCMLWHLQDALRRLILMKRVRASSFGQAAVRGSGP